MNSCSIFLLTVNNDDILNSTISGCNLILYYGSYNFVNVI